MNNFISKLTHNQLESIAKRAEKDGEYEVAIILCTILGAYHVDKLKQFADLTADFSKDLLKDVQSRLTERN